MMEMSYLLDDVEGVGARGAEAHDVTGWIRTKLPRAEGLRHSGDDWAISRRCRNRPRSSWGKGIRTLKTAEYVKRQA